MPNKLYTDHHVEGATSPDGKKYIVFRHGGNRWFCLYSDFFTDPVGALQDLAEQGLPIGARVYATQAIEEARDIGSFPQTEIIPYCGWHGAAFAQPDGRVVVPADARAAGAAPDIGYWRHPGRNDRSGKLAVWKRDIAAALPEIDVAVFAVGLAFAAVIRTLLSHKVQPFGVEFVIDHKTRAMRRLPLSVIGSTSAKALTPDPVERLLAHPARYVEASRDGLLVLAELGDYLCGGQDRKRTAAVRSLLFDHLLAGDGGDNGHGQPAPLFVLVEEASVAEQLELDERAKERLYRSLVQIVVPVGTLARRDDRLMLANLPKRVWGDVIDGMNTTYGVALNAYQRRLVERIAKKGADAVQAGLDHDFKRFRKRAAEVTRHHDDIDLDAVVPPFALVYAALRAAVRLKVLPPSDRYSKCVGDVFKRYLSERPRPTTAADIVTQVAAMPDVLEVDDVDEATGKTMLLEVPAFTKTLPDGTRELWVLTVQRKKTFDWPFFSKLPDYKTWYCGKGEKDRLGTKRPIGGWKDARVLRFQLP